MAVLVQQISAEYLQMLCVDICYNVIVVFIFCIFGVERKRYTLNTKFEIFSLFCMYCQSGVLQHMHSAMVTSYRRTYYSLLNCSLLPATVVSRKCVYLIQRHPVGPILHYSCVGGNYPIPPCPGLKTSDSSRVEKL